MVIVTHVCFCAVFVSEEVRVLRGNPPVRPSDHMTISYADTVYRTHGVAAVSGQCVGISYKSMSIKEKIEPSCI